LITTSQQQKRTQCHCFTQCHFTLKPSRHFGLLSESLQPAYSQSQKFDAYSFANHSNQLLAQGNLSVVLLRVSTRDKPQNNYRASRTDPSGPNSLVLHKSNFFQRTDGTGIFYQAISRRQNHQIPPTMLLLTHQRSSLHINHQIALPFCHFTLIQTTKRPELQTTVSKQRKSKLRRREIS
jgi:hypothetical protein